MVNRIHLRYEDDYFTGETPFAFGAVIDVIYNYLSFYRNFYGNQLIKSGSIVQ